MTGGLNITLTVSHWPKPTVETLMYYNVTRHAYTWFIDIFSFFLFCRHTPLTNQKNEVTLLQDNTSSFRRSAKKALTSDRSPGLIQLNSLLISCGPLITHTQLITCKVLIVTQISTEALMCNNVSQGDTDLLPVSQTTVSFLQHAATINLSTQALPMPLKRH